MERVATVFGAPDRFRSRAARSAVAWALGAAVLTAPAQLAMAQEASPPATPAASPVTAQESELDPAAITSLFSYELDAFPTAPVSVRLLRITLEPGASSPMHTHPGPEFDLVESGTLTVNSTGEADVSRGGGELVTGELAGEALGAGDLVVFPAGTGMNLLNESDEPAVILSAVFHPVSEDVASTQYTEGSPGPEAFEGVSFVVLGDGIIQAYPEGAATIALDRIEVAAGSDLPGATGSALYSLEDGSFAFAVQAGDVQVSRTDAPGIPPLAAPQQEFTLATSDAAFFPAGVEDAARVDQDASLTILRLGAEPSASVAGSPAEIAFLQGAEGAAVDEPAEFTEIAVGAPVVTNTGSVNVRAEPSIEADAVDQLDEGVELTVIGGPEDADDFSWWQVEVDGTEGWVAADFISLVGAPEAEETPEATETPEPEPAATPEAAASPAASPVSATPEAVAQEFAVGDIVALTDDNVRVRGEASINSEPIDVFAAGTQFEITGEAVEADEFTWYPVTLVDDDAITGFVAVDFLEPAEEEAEE